LRSLFRKLALALHPDKVQDPAERATLTTVMKEVTRAYELGDVARLVELERSWLAAPVPCEPEQDIERELQALLQANQELRCQLRTLSAELKSLRDSVAVAFGPPRGARSRAAEGAQDWMLSELERELTEMKLLRDFARAFLNGDMSLAEFLLGPPSPGVDAGTYVITETVEPRGKRARVVRRPAANGTLVRTVHGAGRTVDTIFQTQTVTTKAIATVTDVQQVTVTAPPETVTVFETVTCKPKEC